jgi:serine protease Do
MLKEMDEIILAEAIERYLNGEMTGQEKAFFDDLRKNNAELDQRVVEHIYFLQGLDNFGSVKSFKHLLAETETKLSEEGVIAFQPRLKGKAKVVQLWNKYNSNIQDLVDEIKQTKKDIKDIKNKSSLPAVQPRIEPKVDFRGTGFLIDGKGYLITNAHVISRMKNIYVENNKGEYFNAVAVYTDRQSDLAVIKIADTAYKNISGIPYSIKKNNSDLGELFFTLGFPRNEIVYGEGYVSAKSGSDGDSTAYQLTVSANPGNSGGPIINRNGEIIGIITAKDSKADGVVYAAKSKNIFSMIEKLKDQDSSFKSLKAPAGNALKGLERTQQVKKMEEFVFMVVGN